MMNYTLDLKPRRFRRWDVAVIQPSKYGYANFYQANFASNSRWRANASRRTVWARFNPLWVVLLFGDRWQKRYRWLLDYGECRGVGKL